MKSKRNLRIFRRAACRTGMLVFFTFGTGSPLALAETLDDWSRVNAEAEAAKAFSENDLYLYSSGGFVCSPKADSLPSERILRQFKTRSLGCGCVISSRSIAQSRYAKIFNNAMLAFALRLSGDLNKEDRHANPSE